MFGFGRSMGIFVVYSFTFNIFRERAKGLTMVLYEGSYRVVGHENVPLRDREFKKATFLPRMVVGYLNFSPIMQFV